VPGLVAVPEITPVFAVKPRPAGKEPETMDQVYGGVPALAERVALYEAFCWPSGKEVVEIAGEPDVPAGKNVAMIPLQLAGELKLKVPDGVPGAEVDVVSVAAREVFVFCWLKVNPEPAVTVPWKLGLLKPAPTNTNSLAACVIGVGPVLTEDPLP
jgi:hypothetical protein